MAHKMPRIVFLDIETSPITGYTWGMYDQNVLKVLAPSKIICVAWKWMGDNKVTVKALPDFKGYRGGELNDAQLVREVWKVLDEADIVIAHNGDSFDIKKLNARFIAYGLNAPSFFKTIDTRKVAKKYFRFDNNSLNELGKYLEEGQKASTGGFALWDDCINGNNSAWRRMKLYNVRDVELLERVYLRLRPFIADHPNLAVIALAKGQKPTEHSCPSCGGNHTIRRGSSTTRLGIRQRFQCNDCGSWSSGPLTRAKGVDLR